MAALTVPTIFTAVDKLSSVIAKMQGNVGKFATDTQKKYAAMSRSAQAWSSNARQVAVSAAIFGAAIIAPLALSTKAAMDFEDQMANVATLVDTTKESITAMGKDVLKVFVKVPVPLHDLTEALYKIRSAGVPAAQAMDVLNKSAILGTAGRGTATQGADALTSAINVFKDEGLSTNKIASMLFETVRLGKTTIEGMSESFGSTANVIHAGGVKMADFLSATAAMTVMGEPASQAMNQVRSSVFALEKPTQRMKFLFHELGVKDVREVISKFGNLGNAIQAIEDKGNKLGVNMAKAWGKVQAFAAVIALTGKSGKEAYNNNLRGMGNSEADMAAAYAEKLGTLKAQAQLLKNEIQYFAIKVGTVLIPVLVRLAKFIAPVVEWFGRWIENNPTLAKVIILTVGAIGSLLVVLAPLALIISGVADAMKLYAGIQLYFAASTATATAAVATQSVAVATAGTQLSLFAVEAGAAETAATGFFAILSEFTIPAALVALGGLAIWKVLNHPKWMDGQFADGYKPTFFSPKNPTSPFGNKTQESAYQSWWLKNAKMTSSADTSLNRTNFQKQHGGEYKPILDTIVMKHSFEQNNQNQNNGTIDLHIHDPGKNVDTVAVSNQLKIGIKMGSTTGNK